MSHASVLYYEYIYEYIAYSFSESICLLLDTNITQSFAVHMNQIKIFALKIGSKFTEI